MRALVYTETGRLVYGERPEPVPGPGEVTVEVGLVGICGSDVLGYLGRSPGRYPPLVLGHEFTAWHLGAPVAVNPLIGCGHCRQCLSGRENLCPQLRLVGLHHDGAMRERIAVPEANLVPLLDDDTHERMILAEPFACALNALNLVAGSELERCLILGFGCLGTMCALAWRQLGGGPIDCVDPVPARQALADHFDARAIALEAAIKKRYSHVIDCAGYAELRRAGLSCLRSGGHLLLIGYGEAEGGVDYTEVVRRELHIHGVMAYPAATFRSAVDRLRESRLDIGPLVEVRSLANGQSAFEAVRSRTGGPVKTALRVSTRNR
jgi:threonine dehydrogenase-like Zn-dependent dehydrogenase